MAHVPGVSGLSSGRTNRTQCNRGDELKSGPRDDAPQISRAQASLIAHLSGDALGSLVEFVPVAEIHRRYPDGVRTMADGGTYKTLAGQPTDDGEMTLALARSLVECSAYDAAHAKAAYLRWVNSHPFDCGTTIANALAGVPTPKSQANGALMRVAPIGIFGARRATLDDVAT